MPLDDKILQRLRDNDKTLTSLYLGYRKISAAEAKDIAQSLAFNTSLTELELGHKGKYIAQALAFNTSLTSLYLVDNRISDAGAKDIAQALVSNSSLTLLDLTYNHISDAGAKDIAQALTVNSSLTSVDLGHNPISYALYKQVKNLAARNQKYLKDLQVTAHMQLRVGRLLLYKAESMNGENNLFLELPLEIKEKIVTHLSDNALLTGEQQRLILNYAEGKIAPVADKLSFFKVTKCDRVRKRLNDDKVEAASNSFASIV
jgi:hypothetical protein